MNISNGVPQRKMTKEEAAEDLSSLLARNGISVSPERVLEVFAAHWRKLSMLAHAIHDDWRPQLTALEAAGQMQEQPQ